MEQLRDTKPAKIRIHSLYFYFAATIWTLLRTRFAQFPSVLPVFAKVAIFRSFVAFSMYYHRRNEHEIHRSGIFAREGLGIPLRRNEKSPKWSKVGLFQKYAEVSKRKDLRKTTTETISKPSKTTIDQKAQKTHQTGSEPMRKKVDKPNKLKHRIELQMQNWRKRHANMCIITNNRHRCQKHAYTEDSRQRQDHCNWA